MKFRSSREKRLWIWSLLVVVTIFSVLFAGKPLENQLRSQNVQAIFFLLGMLLVGVTIVLDGLRKSNRLQWVIITGLVAVYVMFFFRLGAPERSHLIEYSILAIFVQEALVERYGKQSVRIACQSFLIVAAVGVLDEIIQIALPHRVFDTQDIVFDALAAGFAIVSINLIRWAKQRFAKS